MKVIYGKYYLVEPGDSIEEIKYYIDIGCPVIGYIKKDNWGSPHLRNLIYSRFGDKINNIIFYVLPDNLGIKHCANYYINYDI